MPTESEAKLARYSETVKEVDEFNRTIGVRRLKPSEQIRIGGMTPDISGYDETTGKNGDKIQIPHRMPLMLAAAVCMIDDVHIPFPRNIGELYAIFDRLDTEGLRAAGKAWVRLNGGPDLDSVIEPKEESKNLSGTPSSA